MKISSSESLTNFLEKTSDITGMSIEFVEFINLSLTKRIKRIPDLDLFQKLTILLPELAKAFGAKKNDSGDFISDKVLQDCIEMTKNRFSFLAFKEIPEAYSLWSSGKFTALEMYSGSFNVKHYGSVLSAYAKYRLPVVRMLSDWEDHIKMIEDSRRKAEAFNKSFKSIVLRERLKIDIWQQVPEFWYDSLLKRKWIDFTVEESHEVFEEAIKLVDVERKRKAIFEKKRSIEILLHGIKPVDEEAKVIARKLIVFRKVVENKSWNPIN